MNPLTYILVKLSFWEQLEKEVKEIIDLFGDFFIMIKEVTYDKIAELVGPDIAFMTVIVIGTILVMLVCLGIINR